MQLSTEQVQTLFSFTEKKGVPWYDLQVELVDHLACRIEEKMEADKSLQFGAVLEKAYKEFGLFGFGKIVQEKQSRLQRAARKLWWKELREFFTWPRIALLLLIVSALWQLAQYADPTTLMRGFAGGYVLISVAYFIHVRRSGKTHRKLLLLDFGRTHFSLVVFLYEVFILFSPGRFSAIEFCLYATLGTLFKSAFFRMNKKVLRQALKLYPGAFA